jgi:hypothetical protein
MAWRNPGQENGFWRVWRTQSIRVLVPDEPDVGVYVSFEGRQIRQSDLLDRLLKRNCHTIWTLELPGPPEGGRHDLRPGGCLIVEGQEPHAAAGADAAVLQLYHTGAEQVVAEAQRVGARDAGPRASSQMAKPPSMVSPAPQLALAAWADSSLRSAVRCARSPGQGAGSSPGDRPRCPSPCVRHGSLASLGRLVRSVDVAVRDSVGAKLRDCLALRQVRV